MKNLENHVAGARVTQAGSRSSTPSPLYIITFDSPRTMHARRATGSFELDFDRMDERTIVNDILAGQFENIDRVFEARLDERSFSDVTDTIARLCADQAERNNRAPQWEILNWIEHHADRVLRIREIA